MVRFVDVADMRRWVTAHGISGVLRGMADAIEHDFRRWPEFDTTARVASHSPVGVIELMPVSDGRLYAFKYVNGHPSNPGRGLQTVTAFGVLADVATGYPVLLSEMTLLTALRTAATSAVAARALARPDSRVMALLGTGSQAEFQTVAFRELLDVTQIRIWDTDPAAMDKFQRHADALGVDVHRASSAREATVGADVITTCTADKAYATVLRDDMVGPGVHINAIGGDCPGKTELEVDLLERAHIVVEYTEQTRIEGEIQQLPRDHAVTELWRVLRGEQPGRTHRDQITVFDSVGFAVEDFSALTFLSRTLGADGSADIDLVAEPQDPKDLFGLVAAATPVLARH